MHTLEWTPSRALPKYQMRQSVTLSLTISTILKYTN